MSLINDALRSARDSQPKATRGADGPTYRPAGSESNEPRPLFSLPFLVTVLLLLAGFFIVNFSVNEGPALQVRARTRRMNAPTAEAAPASVATTSTVEPIKATEPVQTTTAELALATDSAKPAAQTYKLQSIVYNLKHPSALINNHVVFIGEHVGDARVTAIDKETVTIVTTSGQTIVLDMFH